MSQNFECVAGICGDFSRTAKEVRKVLLSHGIECAVEGSVIYSVDVLPEDKVEAKKLLLDLQQQGWDIMFPESL